MRREIQNSSMIRFEGPAPAGFFAEQSSNSGRHLRIQDATGCGGQLYTRLHIDARDTKRGMGRSTSILAGRRWWIRQFGLNNDRGK